MKQGRASLAVRKGRKLLIRGSFLAAILLGLGALSSLNAADTPAAVSDSTNNHVREWFSGLSDDDPAVREQACRKLLTIRRGELPALRAAVKERRPLIPAETEVLRDIVTQVYLSEEAYDGNESVGFVGVIFDADQQFEELPTGGVEVRHRMPGFCASRFLEDGDVILSVGNPPTALLHTHDEMTREVKSNSAGQRLTFLVLRRGRVLAIPVVLDAKPSELTADQPSAIATFLAERQTNAEKYWEAEFEPLIDDAAPQAAK
jgi:hypothetical protein